MAVNLGSIAVELGRSTPEPGTTEAQQWELWVADALMLIGARLGDPDALDAAKVDYVVRKAVAAHVRNPENATQVDVRVDDASVSKRYTSSAGRVTITDDLWAILAPVNLSGAYSVPLGTVWTSP